uniref:Uncharacterized protein n=1 Tax=Ciona savignyi TaxID=51511 RepID=H2Z9X3_CIOSA
MYFRKSSFARGRILQFLFLIQLFIVIFSFFFIFIFIVGFCFLSLLLSLFLSLPLVRIRSHGKTRVLRRPIFNPTMKRLFHIVLSNIFHHHLISIPHQSVKHIVCIIGCPFPYRSHLLVSRLPFPFCLQFSPRVPQKFHGYTRRSMS